MRILLIGGTGTMGDDTNQFGGYILQDCTITPPVGKHFVAWAENDPSGTTFNVSISFGNDGNLKLGMSASCEVVLEEVTDVLTVPIAAVQTEDDKKYVVIINDDGDTENVEITTGLSDDDYVEIKSGLEEGQIVQVATTTTQSTTRNNNSSGKQNGERGGSNMGGFQGGNGEMPSGIGEPPSVNSRGTQSSDKN